MCRFRPSSSSSGMNSHPWLRTIFAPRPVLPAATAGVKADDAVADVGVAALLVRGAVVGVVLVHPPAVAQPAEDAAEHHRDPLVPLVRGEHLPVRAVVAEEHELRQDDRERPGEQELVPGVPDQEHPHPDRRERGHRCGDPPPVPAAPAAEQVCALDAPQQLGVGADMALGNRRPRARGPAPGGDPGRQGPGRIGGELTRLAEPGSLGDHARLAEDGRTDAGESRVAEGCGRQRWPICEVAIAGPGSGPDPAPGIGQVSSGGVRPVASSPLWGRVLRKGPASGGSAAAAPRTRFAARPAAAPAIEVNPAATGSAGAASPGRRPRRSRRGRRWSPTRR